MICQRERRDHQNDTCPRVSVCPQGGSPKTIDNKVRPVEFFEIPVALAEIELVTPLPSFIECFCQCLCYNNNSSVQHEVI